MENTRPTTRTPSPSGEGPPAYSPPRPTVTPPSPTGDIKKPLPVIIIPDTKSLASSSTSSLQSIAPYRGSFYPPPPIPASGYHSQPHDGRPRDDMPYQAPQPMEAGPEGFSRPSTAGRRQTMYFDAAKANRHSVMSYDSRTEKREKNGEEEKKGSWNFTGWWMCCLVCMG